MTSDEIKNAPTANRADPRVDYSSLDADRVAILWAQANWLKECAYQLAVMNEQRERRIHDELAREYLKGVAHGRSDSFGSPVGADSDKIVREDDGELINVAPPLNPSTFRHPFNPSSRNRYCGDCGAGRLHAIHS